jgi:hypothetical protein
MWTSKFNFVHEFLRRLRRWHSFNKLILRTDVMEVIVLSLPTGLAQCCCARKRFIASWASHGSKKKNKTPSRQSVFLTLMSTQNALSGSRTYDSVEERTAQYWTSIDSLIKSETRSIFSLHIINDIKIICFTSSDVMPVCRGSRLSLLLSFFLSFSIFTSRLRHICAACNRCAVALNENNWMMLFCLLYLTL